MRKLNKIISLSILIKLIQMIFGITTSIIIINGLSNSSYVQWMSILALASILMYMDFGIPNQLREGILSKSIEDLSEEMAMKFKSAVATLLIGSAALLIIIAIWIIYLYKLNNEFWVVYLCQYILISAFIIRNTLQTSFKLNFAYGRFMVEPVYSAISSFLIFFSIYMLHLNGRLDIMTATISYAIIPIFIYTHSFVITYLKILKIKSNKLKINLNLMKKGFPYSLYQITSNLPILALPILNKIYLEYDSARQLNIIYQYLMVAIIITVAINQISRTEFQKLLNNGELKNIVNIQKILIMLSLVCVLILCAIAKITTLKFFEIHIDGEIYLYMGLIFYLSIVKKILDVAALASGMIFNILRQDIAIIVIAFILINAFQYASAGGGSTIINLYSPVLFVSLTWVIVRYKCITKIKKS